MNTYSTGTFKIGHILGSLLISYTLVYYTY